MAQSQSKKLSSTRNPIARLLKHFTPQRFKDKTKYNRKTWHTKRKHLMKYLVSWT